MKITIVCDTPAVDNGDFIEPASVAKMLRERGHETVTVCFDESFKDNEGYIVIPGIRPLGQKALEDAIWDSDAVFIASVSPLGRAAMRICKAHIIPVAALFTTQGSMLSFRKFTKRNAHCDMMRLSHLYETYLRFADAVIYPSYIAKKAVEASAGEDDNSFVVPAVPEDEALIRLENILLGIHI